MKLSRRHWEAPLLTLAGLLSFGCDETEEEPSIAVPSLSVSATNECGKNFAAVPTLEEINAGTYSRVRVTATGTDPNTSSGQFVSGTTVFLALDGTDSAKGYFASSYDKLSTANKPLSKGLPMLSGQASDDFFCTAPGTVRIRAYTTDYRPGGAGDPVDVETLRGASFPVQCVTAAEYERRCNEGEDAGTDADLAETSVSEAGTDAGADASDASDAVATPETWSINYEGPGAADLVIGIRGGGNGRVDNVRLGFKVAEFEQGIPNIPVRFSLPPNAPPNLVLEPTETKTNAEGIASVRLVAGGTPGVVSVTATAIDVKKPCENSAQCAGGQICVEYDGTSSRCAETARSDTVVIRGGVPSMKSMLFTCEHKVIPAFTDIIPQDNNYWEWQLPNAEGTDCVVQLADRLSGRVDRATQVFFLTEAGTIDEASTTDDEGRAKTRLRIGRQQPYNVSPPTPSPADGMVKLIAVTRGEEDFNDLNGDHIYDKNVDLFLPDDGYTTPWILHDLPDPFVDMDGDNNWSEDEEGFAEPFRDADRNGSWSPPSGQWESDTEIWVSTVVLWVGTLYPKNLTVNGPRNPVAGVETSYIKVTPASSGSEVNPGCNGLGAAYNLGRGDQLLIEARFTDQNGNCLNALDQQEISIELESAELVAGFDTQKGGFRCFDTPEIPGVDTHYWTVMSTAEGPDEEGIWPDPTIGSAKLTLRYALVDGGLIERSWSVRTCQ